MTTMTAAAPRARPRRWLRRRRRGWIWAGRLAAVGVLLLVFGAYRQPDMLMQMAQQLWSCFG